MSEATPMATEELQAPPVDTTAAVAAPEAATETFYDANQAPPAEEAAAAPTEAAPAAPVETPAAPSAAVEEAVAAATATAAPEAAAPEATAPATQETVKTEEDPNSQSSTATAGLDALAAECTTNTEEALANAERVMKDYERDHKPDTRPSSAPRRKPSAAKKKPIDYGPIITTPEPMDVLSGRGAAVNNHPGNKKFRALCFVRKAHFDLGNHAAKRQLATEIVNLLQNGKDHPPSRFLKKRPPIPEAQPAPPEDPSAAAEGGPAPILYYAMTKEQAILKAQQVMRDYKRPDRLEAKALQQQARYALGADGTATTLPKPHRARATPSTPLEGVVDFLQAPDVEADTLFRANPFGVHAHDVLSGRGAYVNGHVGNARLRQLALDRKAAFDAGNYTDKRQLANEIVTIIKSLDPPGRFLKKADAELLALHEAAAKAKAEAEAPKTEAVKEEAVKTEGDETAKPKEDEAIKAADDAVGAPVEGTTAAADAAPAPPPVIPADLPPLIDGTWEELTDDKAIHKACQVMRDISRPDRKHREERKQDRLKRKDAAKRRKLGGAPTPEGAEGAATAAAAEGAAPMEVAAAEAKPDDAATAATAAAVEAAAQDASAAAVEVVDKALLDSAAAAAASVPENPPPPAVPPTVEETVQV